MCQLICEASLPPLLLGSTLKLCRTLFMHRSDLNVTANFVQSSLNSSKDWTKGWTKKAPNVLIFFAAQARATLLKAALGNGAKHSQAKPGRTDDEPEECNFGFCSIVLSNADRWTISKQRRATARSTVTRSQCRTDDEPERTHSLQRSAVKRRSEYAGIKRK